MVSLYTDMLTISFPSLHVGFGAVLVLGFVALPLAMIIAAGEHYIEQFVQYFRNRVGGITG